MRPSARGAALLGGVGGRGTGGAAARRGAGRPFPLRARLAERLRPVRLSMRRDLDLGRGFLWWPVAFATAVAAYFALPAEPSWIAVAAPAALAAVAALATRLRTGRSPLPLALAAMAAAGVVAAKLQVERLEGPVLSHARSVTITGTVEAVEDRGSRGHRLRVQVEAMDPAPADGLPRFARVSVRGRADPPLPGARIRLLARVGPPQAAVYPGGYDFGRAAFFAGIGASGFALGPVEHLADAEAGGGFDEAVARFRLAVSRDIRATLSGDAGAIAAALIVGDRGAIDPATDEAMRVSGLSHVLSISGLHMALVAACLYGGLRAVLALVPRLALTLPIKAMAAAVALAGAIAYLVIAGLGLATQRSAVMIALTLSAVIIGRRAFSLRGVAVAAMVVFAIQPHAVLDPGAQLSFAAVTALIAGWEAYLARRGTPTDRGDVSVVVRAAVALVRWIGLSMLTSVLAGLATAPIALHHFNRAAPLGLVANLVAMPLISLVIMPAGLIAALAMPIGLDALPLLVMGAGIEGMLAVARTVSEWTPGGGVLGRPATAATLLMVCAGLWLCLWTGAARLLAIPVFAAGLALAPLGERPDLVVAGDGRRAVVTLPGRDPVLLGRPDDFETAIWLAALGDQRRPDDASLVAGTTCDPAGCVLRAGEGGRPDRGPVLAALVFRPVAFADECVEAALVIAAVPAPDWCRALTTVIDVDDLARTGARTYVLESKPPDRAGPDHPLADRAGHAVSGRPGPDHARPRPALPDSALPDPRPAAGAAHGGPLGASAPGRGWRLVELGRALPERPRPFDIGSP